jgi:hypothetical protein
MRRKLLVGVASCVLVLGLSAGVAWAADSMAVNIPFAFTAAGTALPAGTYDIGTPGNDMSKLVIQASGAVGGVGATVAPVLERLANLGTKHPVIVFDKVEGKYYLSEAHYPGMDGFLVGVEGGKETHEVITGKPVKNP